MSSATLVLVRRNAESPTVPEFAAATIAEGDPSCQTPPGFCARLPVPFNETSTGYRD